MIKITHTRDNMTSTTFCQEKALVSRCKDLQSVGYEIVSKHPTSLIEIAELEHLISKPEPAYKQQRYVEKVYR